MTHIGTGIQRFQMPTSYLQGESRVFSHQTGQLSHWRLFVHDTCEAPPGPDDGSATKDKGLPTELPTHNKTVLGQNSSGKYSQRILTYYAHKYLLSVHRFRNEKLQFLQTQVRHGLWDNVIKEWSPDSL
jgi:hypothetical protein